MCDRADCGAGSGGDRGDDCQGCGDGGRVHGGWGCRVGAELLDRDLHGGVGALVGWTGAERVSMKGGLVPKETFNRFQGGGLGDLWRLKLPGKSDGKMTLLRVLEVVSGECWPFTWNKVQNLLSQRRGLCHRRLAG